MGRLRSSNPRDVQYSWQIWTLEEIKSRFSKVVQRIVFSGRDMRSPHRTLNDLFHQIEEKSSIGQLREVEFVYPRC